jgi:hypothetical protein
VDWRDPETLRELIQVYDLRIEQLTRSGNACDDGVLTAIVERIDLRNELEFVLGNQPPSDEAGAAVRVPRTPPPSSGSAMARPDPES